jgi:hypothetical protein
MIKLIGTSILATVFMLCSMGVYAGCKDGFHSCKVAGVNTCCVDTKAAASSSGHKAPIGSASSNGHKLPRHTM